MPNKAFLKKKSFLDDFRDNQEGTGYIQSARAERTWNNPITRGKRTKKLNTWIKSFDGKRHIRKLARFNRMQHENLEEAMSLTKFTDVVTDKLIKQYDVDEDAVLNYVDSHSQELQELLDDKELSLKEKVLFLREEITGVKNEKKSEKLVVSNPCVVYKGDAENAAKAHDYLYKKMPRVKGASISSDVEPRGNNKFCRVLFYGNNTGVMKLFGYYSNMYDEEFWNNCEADPDGWVNPQTIDRYDVATPRQESKKSESVEDDCKRNAHDILNYIKKATGYKNSYLIRVSVNDDEDDFYIKYNLGTNGNNYILYAGVTDYSITDLKGENTYVEGSTDLSGAMNKDLDDFCERIQQPFYTEANEPADEKLSYEKGHKNSKGEDAPWVIRSHEDNRVLASFPTKKEAEDQMQRMKQYSKTESKQNEMNNHELTVAVQKAADSAGAKVKIEPAGALFLEVYMENKNHVLERAWYVDEVEQTITPFEFNFETTEWNTGANKSYSNSDELTAVMTDFFKDAQSELFEAKKSESKKNEEFETIADREIQVRKPGQSWARWTVTWPEYVEMHKQDAKDKGWPEIRVRKLALNGRDAEVIEGPDESNKSEAKKSESLINKNEMEAIAEAEESRILDAVQKAAKEAGVDDRLKVSSDKVLVKATLPINNRDIGEITWVVDGVNGKLTEYVDGEKGYSKKFKDEDPLKDELRICFAAVKDVAGIPESKKTEEAPYVHFEYTDTIRVPQWLWVAYQTGEAHDLNEDELEILDKFKEEYGSKYHMDDKSEDPYFSSRNDFDNLGGNVYDVDLYVEKPVGNKSTEALSTNLEHPFSFKFKFDSPRVTYAMRDEADSGKYDAELTVIDDDATDVELFTDSPKAVLKLLDRVAERYNDTYKGMLTRDDLENHFTEAIALVKDVDDDLAAKYFVAFNGKEPDGLVVSGELDNVVSFLEAVK